ncbi:MAG: alpha/beta fold hydrolase [Propionibacteriales bacterium]|nr:alpha/beta fold hydrolase [Propionibacteriales bacterium]
MTMEMVELSTGTIEYVDTGGDGPVLVLLHGLLMDPSLWAGVIDELRTDHRCVAPTLPLGAHSQPMGPGADLSMRGIAGMVAEFLERLDLRDVTLVGNDTGGALVQLLMCDQEPRVGKAVLVSCDAFDNFPPGMSGKTLVLTGKLSPAVFGVFMQQMRLKPVRRLPFTLGWLTKRGDTATARWMKPILTQSEIRKDTVRVLRSISANRTLMQEAAEGLPAFDRPTLIVWAKEDRVMPPEHGRRLAALLRQSRLVEVSDSYTLIPLDQPAKLAESLREFTLVTPR